MQKGEDGKRGWPRKRDRERTGVRESVGVWEERNGAEKEVQ